MLKSVVLGKVATFEFDNALLFKIKRLKALAKSS